MTSPAIHQDIQSPYSLSEDQVSFYEANRFIKLKNVLSADVLDHYRESIGAFVGEKSRNRPSLEKLNTYGKAFIQVFNLWRESVDIRELVFSKRLAGIAAGLMQTEGVRIYHDQALFKEGGGGITPWHADQYYWPLATDKCITAWIPLHAVPHEMGPLEFSAGSHRVVEGRELKISDESEAAIQERLRISNCPRVAEPFESGEVSFHSGWTFHRAGPNTTGKMRHVMTIIYMDKNMRLKDPENENQKEDWEVWCPGAEIGAVIDTALNPVI
jgi:ectoine hydroxylase-related dioxygenase (phytanoyl-CoA dioxygenase family)